MDHPVVKLCSLSPPRFLVGAWWTGGRRGTDGGDYGGRSFWRRERRGAVSTVSAHAEQQGEAVEPRGDEFADERQRVKSDSKAVTVVQQTGAFPVARLLLDEARRVNRGTIERRRRKAYDAHGHKVIFNSWHNAKETHIKH